MANVFSAVEIVEIGIEIEKNGRDFYAGIVKISKSDAAKKVFEFLKSEEEKHVKRFEHLLSQVKKYESSESYTGEYYAYLKALSEEYVFTKRGKGLQIANSIENDSGAIVMAMGFERDSILFYHEMKRFVLKDEQEIVDKLIQEEQEHLRMLGELKSKL